jgi:hypothetical protein
VDAPRSAASVRASVAFAKETLNKSGETLGLSVLDDGSHHLTIGPLTRWLERGAGRGVLRGTPSGMIRQCGQECALGP